MRTKQKWLSVLGAALLGIAAVTFPGATEVQAAGAPVVTSSIGNVTAEVGDTITIPITFSSETANITAIHGEPSKGYDSSLLQYEGTTYAGIPAGMESGAGGNLGYVTSSNNAFAGGTINMTFKVLKCSETPVTVTVNNLYFSNAQGDSDSTTLVSNITVNHPADQYQTTVDDPATCTEAGHKTVVCGLCGTVISDTDIPELGHDDGVWTVTKPSTCVEKGTQERRCGRCGELLETAELDLAAHTWDDGKVIKEATCSEEGEMLYTCTVCEKATKTETIAKTAHTWTVSDDTDADGWKVVTEATADAEGSKERVCSVCGEKETEVIEKLGSTTTVTPTEKPDTKPTTTNKPSTGTTGGTTTTGSAVKTGDNSLMAVYVALLAAAACGVTAAVVVKRRNARR